MTSDLWSFLDSFADGDIMVRRGGADLRARDVRAEARRLQAKLLQGEGPVFLYCEDAGNFLAGLLAALGAGRNVLLPGHIAPGYLAEIGAVGADFLCDVGQLAGAEQVLVAPVDIFDAAGDLRPSPDATIGFFTSGSTGAPKICIKSQQQILSEAGMHVDLWGKPDGPVIGTVSHQHIYGLLFRVLWPLMAGRSIEAIRQEMWESVAFVARPGCVFVSSPAHLSRIPDGLRLEHRPVHVFSSGGPLSYAAARDAFEKFGRTPVEVLGSTETGGVAWRQQESAASLWTPLPMVVLQSDEAGGLAVRSPFTGEAGFVSMGDRVEFASDGCFSLHARLDRIVKVEGKRISLPRVEEALRGLEAVVDAVTIDLPDRGGALGAVVVLAQSAADEMDAIGAFRYSRLLRRALSVRLEPMELPRFWRIVDRIPENAQGKRVAADLRNLFARTFSDVPRVLEREVSEAEARFSLELGADLRWFDGHFPEQPILPGVAQLHIASAFAEEVWGFVATGSDMARIKFRKVMQPGDRVTLNLVRNGADRLDFRYVMNGEVAASGAIKGVEA